MPGADLGVGIDGHVDTLCVEGPPVFEAIEYRYPLSRLKEKDARKKKELLPNGFYVISEMNESNDIVTT